MEKDTKSKPKPVEPVSIEDTIEAVDAVLTSLETVELDPHAGKGGEYFIDVDGVRKPVKN